MARAAKSKTNGWTKVFANKSPLLGLDHQAMNGLVSWSKSSFDNLYTVNLSHENQLIEIEADKTSSHNFWQSDILEVNSNNPSEILWVKRRIQKQITENDVFVVITHPRKNYYKLQISKSRPAHTLRNVGQVENIFLTLPEDIGKWITLTLDINTMRTNWSIEDRRF